MDSPSHRTMRFGEHPDVTPVLIQRVDVQTTLAGCDKKFAALAE